jgi:hypothetical protein
MQCRIERIHDVDGGSHVRKWRPLFRHNKEDMIQNQERDGYDNLRRVHTQDLVSVIDNGRAGLNAGRGWC